MRRQRSSSHPAAALPRTDRRIADHRSDAYGMRAKLPSPSACPACGAVYVDGRWRWGPPPPLAHRTACPACRRTEDGVPAGLLTLRGSFVAEHMGEIQGLIRNVEQREQATHPLKRVMSIREEEGALLVPTTDARLALALGKALEHAYEGTLQAPFTEPENVLRVTWSR